MLKCMDLICWLLIVTVLINEKLVEGRTILKTMNEAIIKTIKVDANEIIDCYDIYRQPSLSHHFLYNHTIQMTPSSYPKRMKLDNFGTYQLTQTWHKYGSCPKGTIPIRRKGKNYNPTLLHKHNPPKFSLNKNHVTSQFDDPTNGHEYAAIAVDGNFLGAQAKINLWNPVTETNQTSISQIWVQDGFDNDTNSIEAGWIVYQDLYNDDRTRFFISWTTDSYQRSGCYDLLCAGFVHTSSDIALGCSFDEVSTFKGAQKDATFNIHKDQSSGNWWIQLQGIPIGYYPSSLFTKFSKTATSVSWGGEIINKMGGRHTTTQMGSGHFPSEGGLGTSSYFNWVQVVDANNMMKDPDNIEVQVTNPNCYDLKIDTGHHDKNGYGFFYGGPGYNDKCQ